MSSSSLVAQFVQLKLERQFLKRILFINRFLQVENDKTSKLPVTSKVSGI